MNIATIRKKLNSKINFKQKESSRDKVIARNGMFIVFLIMGFAASIPCLCHTGSVVSQCNNIVFFIILLRHLFFILLRELTFWDVIAYITIYLAWIMFVSSQAFH